MRSPIGVIIGLVLAWLAFKLFADTRAAYSAEVVDQSRVVTLFGCLVLVGLALGVLFVTTVLPLVADWIANFFYNPNESIEKGPHADAMAAVARGDFEAAIEEYKKAAESDPADTLALGEMARIFCENLDAPQRAVETLETALTQDRIAEDAAFLTSRLADVHWTHLHDAPRARARLMEIIETMPQTTHAANARYRLHEIDRQLAAGA